MQNPAKTLEKSGIESNLDRIIHPHEKDPGIGQSETDAQNGISLSSVHPCIVSLREPDSPIAEEYRKLKSLILRLTREEFKNTLMVTSALSGEGKSITTANLAVMLARDYGQTVLLVDADLRRPSLSEYLGISATLGLADCLEDDLDPGRAIIKTGIPKLSFLPAGKRPVDTAELLSSGRMKQVLSELKNRYRDRYIIVDTPPLLLFSETQAMSTIVDAVLGVVQEGETTRNSVQQMLDLLKGSNLIGLVYNNSSTASVDKRYRHYYKYYHRSASSKTPKNKG